MNIVHEYRQKEKKRKKLTIAGYWSNFRFRHRGGTSL